MYQTGQGEAVDPMCNMSAFDEFALGVMKLYHLECRLSVEGKSKMNLVAKKLKFLIVDDEPAVLDLLEVHLSGWDLSYDRAEDGVQAAPLCEKQKYDAIITDLHMPNLNGLELITAIRAGKLNQKTPVFLTTGILDKKTSAQIAKLGDVEVILKPFIGEDFIAAVVKDLKMSS